MTGSAFSLSPPGSFALSADPAFQDEVRRELERVLERVRECAAAPCVVGVLLTGSFARGEGTVIANPESGSRWLSDVECLVVVRGGVISKQEIQRAMRQVERDTNSESGVAARGIKVELRAILIEGMLRLRPAIFTRELCEHAKLIWGDPAAIPAPRVAISGAAISRHDAFRLLNNRIIEQIAVRSEYADRASDSIAVAYSLAKFWIDLGTSLSVFLGCYLPGYQSRQKPVEDAILAHPEILGAEMSGRLICRFRNAMAQKLGQARFPSGDLAPEFNEAVEIARATWNWESAQLTGATAAGGDWRGIFARLGSLETAAQRLRDWARLLRQPSGVQQLGPRAMLAAARVGSLATLIYGSGCVIDFFWDEIGSDRGRGTEMVVELSRALGVKAQEPSERRRQLTRATLGAWERHLRFAAA
jgi:predicted nucleotidyltransferase